MDANIITTLITGGIAIITVVVNMGLTIHRNKQDSVTTYRMAWINEIREEYSKILSWDFKTQDAQGKTIFNPINDIQRSVYKVSLMLNTKDTYDKELLDLTFTYLENIESMYNSYFLQKELSEDKAELISKQGEESYDKTIQHIEKEFDKALDNILEIKYTLHKKIRVYLKAEWTRIKAESSIIKFKYRKYYTCSGFNSEKVIKETLENYKTIDYLYF